MKILFSQRMTAYLLSATAAIQLFPAVLNAGVPDRATAARARAARPKPEPEGVATWFEPTRKCTGHMLAVHDFHHGRFPLERGGLKLRFGFVQYRELVNSFINSSEADSSLGLL